MLTEVLGRLLLPRGSARSTGRKREAQPGRPAFPVETDNPRFGAVRPSVPPRIALDSATPGAVDRFPPQCLATTVGQVLDSLDVVKTEARWNARIRRFGIWVLRHLRRDRRDEHDNQTTTSWPIDFWECAEPVQSVSLATKELPDRAVPNRDPRFKVRVRADRSSECRGE